MTPATTNATSLFDRPDTFLGVCQGIGEDFGFNANWLRVALGVGVLWNPVVVLAIYATLGVAVLASRLLFPKPRAAAAVAVAPAAAADNDAADAPLARAA